MCVCVVILIRTAVSSATARRLCSRCLVVRRGECRAAARARESSLHDGTDLTRHVFDQARVGVVARQPVRRVDVPLDAVDQAERLRPHEMQEDPQFAALGVKLHEQLRGGASAHRGAGDVHDARHVDDGDVRRVSPKGGCAEGEARSELQPPGARVPGRVPLVPLPEERGSPVELAGGRTDDVKRRRVRSAHPGLQGVEPRGVRGVGLDRDGAHAAPRRWAEERAKPLDDFRSAVPLGLGQLAILDADVGADVEEYVVAVVLLEEAYHPTPLVAEPCQKKMPAELDAGITRLPPGLRVM